MGSTNDLQAAYSLKERQAALEAALASKTFFKNARLARLLAYLCAKAFAGESSSLKEYTIATDVFARAVDFDQSTDAIVRVEMHRLRKKLKEYYATEGADQNIEIVIQSGHYAPDFVERQSAIEWKTETATVIDPVIEVPATIVTVAVPHKTTERKYPRSIWAVAGGLALVLAGAVWFVVHSRSGSNGAGITESLPVVPPETGAVRILCGRTRPQRDREGHEWGWDAYFEGGSTLDSPQQLIYRTRNAFVYQGGRTGEFSYKIPLKPGIYEVHLHFADTSFAPGMSMEGGENIRAFNVDLNGRTLLRDFDIIASAGPNTAFERVFKDVEPDRDGYLHLTFTHWISAPLLNAIEILPAVAHRIKPIRISTQDSGFVDKSGTTWEPDNYFLNGRAIAKMGMISGPVDSQIYERERYGNFSYAIPAAPGKYALTLHFAETYFGPHEQGAGGAGSRIFDVYCNGTVLLKNLDIFQEAGSRRQLIKTFRGIEPNAQGNVLISFVPIKNYAMVSGIELVDETP